MKHPSSTLKSLQQKEGNKNSNVKCNANSNRIVNSNANASSNAIVMLMQSI